MVTTAIAPVLIGDEWRLAEAASTFQAKNPATGETLPGEFPVSRWADCDAALTAASEAFERLLVTPPQTIAAFLEKYADKLDAHAEVLAQKAAEETALPLTPRLKEVELPRTTNQLRQAASAAREESWRRPVLDLKRNIRSYYAAIGPVVIFGPNNFPFAYNGVSGGDFAAAIATGNPVIAKAHPLHPGTSRLLAEQALAAAQETGMPSGSVQMLYGMSNEDGLRLVSDPRIGAVGFTGSRGGGLALKHAADKAGKPIYLEMSSINPVIFLPGAVAERGTQMATELADSCLAAAGQFCTSPNLVLMIESEPTAAFIRDLARILDERAPQPLLSEGGWQMVDRGVKELMSSGAALVTGGEMAESGCCRYRNTLLRVSGTKFLANQAALEREVFGNALLVAVANDEAELRQIIAGLEGNLTGSFYSAKSGADDTLYNELVPMLRRRVGRLLNDKMPTGVAVSPAMNHGGPYPSTGHPGFTAVGIPASLGRFAMLQCFDGIREERLPLILRDRIDNPETWRSIDGDWVRG